MGGKGISGREEIRVGTLRRGSGRRDIREDYVKKSGMRRKRMLEGWR